ncbi:hypothetical protein LXM63_19370 [Chryseobacterium gleum]|uniref:hypothetical protein n=1 Tax=Chryseobacterium gleum TaxID=250 RepID=UPI001E638279|nr:hypothetical protein [Chryseobacterium gleum]MCE4067271.1 hypothetical protein [Chryseobacterium gleum]
MKKIKYFITAVTIGFITASCANDLNTLPDGDISGEQLNNDANSPEKYWVASILIFAAMVREALPCTQISESWESRRVLI